VKKNSNPRREVDRLLSVEQLADVLQIPAKTVYEWRCRGEGPAGIRVGRYLRFDPADVADWIDARKSRATPLRG
jgi:excisionase family DNA binding protein